MANIRDPHLGLSWVHDAQRKEAHPVSVCLVEPNLATFCASVLYQLSSVHDSLKPPQMTLRLCVAIFRLSMAKYAAASRFHNVRNCGAARV